MYIVVFTGKNHRPASFITKDAAMLYKSEHPDGKFASVIKDSGTYFEGEKRDARS